MVRQNYIDINKNCFCQVHYFLLTCIFLTDLVYEFIEQGGGRGERGGERGGLTKKIFKIKNNLPLGE